MDIDECHDGINGDCTGDTDGYNGSDDHPPRIPIRRWHRTEPFHVIVSSIHITEMDEDSKDGSEKGYDDIKQPMSSPRSVVVKG